MTTQTRLEYRTRCCEGTIKSSCTVPTQPARGCNLRRAMNQHPISYMHHVLNRTCRSKCCATAPGRSRASSQYMRSLPFGWAARLSALHAVLAHSSTAAGASRCSVQAAPQKSLLPGRSNAPMSAPGPTGGRCCPCAPAASMAAHSICRCMLLPAAQHDESCHSRRRRRSRAPCKGFWALRAPPVSCLAISQCLPSTEQGQLPRTADVTRCCLTQHDQCQQSRQRPSAAGRPARRRGPASASPAMSCLREARAATEGVWRHPPLPARSA